MVKSRNDKYSKCNHHLILSLIDDLNVTLIMDIDKNVNGEKKSFIKLLSTNIQNEFIINGPYLNCSKFFYFYFEMSDRDIQIYGNWINKIRLLAYITIPQALKITKIALKNGNFATQNVIKFLNLGK